MDKKTRIYVAGHRGMVGQALCRALEERGFENLITRTSDQLDLRNQETTRAFFEKEHPDCVLLAAAKVGGILANIKAPAEFLYDNMMIQANVIHSSYLVGVQKLLFLASSCIYPRHAPQPMKEEYLLDGKVEPTNEGYAIAKIAGLKLCEMYNRQYGTNYISVMPSNLYGYNDNFDPLNSHVVPGLIRKFHEGMINDAPFVEVWGTGNARRELLFSEDMADACMFLLEKYSGSEFFNIGTGTDISIRELAHMIASIVGYTGEIRFDTSKPDGMPQKLMDVGKLKEYGWVSSTSLEEGLGKTYRWYLDNIKQ